MKHTKEYQEFVKHYGKNADLFLLHIMQQQKGKLNETKRAKILGTLRTGKDDSGSIRDGNPPSKVVSTDKFSDWKER